MSCVVKNGFYAAQAIYILYRVVQSDNTLLIRSVRPEHFRLRRRMKLIHLKHVKAWLTA